MRFSLQLVHRAQRCGCPGCMAPATHVPQVQNNIGQNAKGTVLTCNAHVRDARWRWPSSPEAMWSAGQQCEVQGCGSLATALDDVDAYEQCPLGSLESLGWQTKVYVCSRHHDHFEVRAIVQEGGYVDFHEVSCP